MTGDQSRERVGGRGARAAPYSGQRWRFWPTGRGLLVASGVVLLLVTGAMVAKHLHHDWKDAPVWYDAGRRVLSGDVLVGIENYRYPPTFAVLIAPLCLLPFAAFWFVWYGINLALFVVSVWLTGRLVGQGLGGDGHMAEPPVAGAASYAMLSMVTVYAIDNLFLGQTNILVMALVYWTLLLLLQRREWWAGLPLGAAIAIKVFPAPMLAYLLLRWRLRAVASTLAATAFFLFVFPAPARGLRRNYLEVKDWGLRVVEPYLSRGQAGDWGQHALDFGNQSVQAVLHRYLTRVDANVLARRGKPIYINIANLSDRSVNLIVLAVSIALATVFLAACGWRRPRGPDQEMIEYSLVVIGLLLVSAIAWTYFFVMLLLPIAVAVRLLPVGQAARPEPAEGRPGSPLSPRSAGGLWIAFSLFVLATALLRIHHLRALGSLGLVSIALYVALALACWGIRRGRKVPTASPAPTAR